MERPSQPDFRPPPTLTELDWTDEHAPQSARSLRDYVIEQIVELDDWYLKKRRSKRVAGYATRLSAIVLTAFAAATPALNQVVGLEPGWAIVALAAAGALVAFDRFGGFTSAWARYIEASHTLGRIMNTFRLDWERISYRHASSPQQAISAWLERCRIALGEMSSLLQAETEQWKSEFLGAVKSIDQDLRPARIGPATGRVRILVDNADEATEGWVLDVNGDTRGTFHSREATIEVPSGDHVLTAHDNREDPPRTASAHVRVGEGDLADVRLDLH